MAETPADWRCSRSASAAGSTRPTSSPGRGSPSITPVSLDHQQYLGETLAEIAAREGRHPEARRPLRRRLAAARGARRDRGARRGGRRRRSRSPTATGRSGRSTAAWPSSTRPASSTCRRPRLIGAHQVANAGIALAALRALGADEAACAAAVTRRRMAGAAAAPAPRPAGRGRRRRRALARRRPQPGRRRGARRGARAACRRGRCTSSAAC